MRQCPQCSSLYEDEIESCPVDAGRLSLPDSRLGSIIDGKYRVEARLGGGGQGTVYLVTHIHLQRTSALKVVRADGLNDPEAVERFKREALALARMQHPGIVTVHDFGMATETGAYLVMEHLSGRTLRAEIAERGRLPVSEATDIARAIGSAVHAAHQHGVIHRDLKPDNIFLAVDAEGHSNVKVLDFGLASMRALADTMNDPITVAGAMMGTPSFMAPEQFRGEAPDTRSDIYSIGCMLFEMLTGRRVFVSETLVGLMQMHLNVRPDSPSDLNRNLPSELNRVVLTALAKDRDRRYQSVGDFIRALDVACGKEALQSIASRPAELAESDVSDEITMQPGDAQGGDDAADATDIASPNNLPSEVTSFVGREREVHEVERLLAEFRLVTLTGPGGSGKTRVSLRVARRVMRRFPHGVWFAELAPLTDPSLVPLVVSASIGVREEAARSVLDVLIESLGSKHVLVVLDNCEHLIEATARFAASLLRACPNVRILATSQEALNVAGERLWSAPPLSLPDAESPRSPDQLEASEAVRLFVERAVMHSPRFELTPENADAVARICMRLDGIPLALELAAARVKVLSVEQIAERLDDRFRLLTGGGRGVDARQRTLRGTLDWSHELLTGLERIVFRRLAVFAGGCSLDAAELVCAGGEVDAFEVLDLLARLADKSLVASDEVRGVSRFRMLQTIRHYGLDRLVESGEEDTVRQRHGRFFLDFAEGAEREMGGALQSVWLAKLDQEHDNLRGALEWYRSTGDDNRMLRLTGALAKFWYIHGHEREGRSWLDASLRRPGGSDAARAKALVGAGSLARVQRDYDSAEKLVRESLDLWRSLGDEVGLANALNHLGFIAQWRGEYESAEQLHSESLARARDAGDDSEVATALNNLGVIARYRADYAGARDLFHESLALFRRLGDKRYIAGTLNNLGVIAAIEGDLELASRLQEEHLAIRRELGDRRGLAAALTNLGEIMQMRRSHGRAARLLVEGMTLYEESGDRRGVAITLESFVSLAIADDDASLALRLAGAAAELRRAIESPLSPAEAEEFDRQLVPARNALGADRAEAEFRLGCALPVEQAVRSALELASSTTFAS